MLRVSFVLKFIEKNGILFAGNEAYVMFYRCVDQAQVRDRRVIVRAGFDVPVQGTGTVADTFRLERGLPTLKWLVRRRAKVIILSHRGQPRGKAVQKLSLQPVAKELARMLKHPVGFVRLDPPKLRSAVAAMQSGDVLLVENIRFDDRERTGSQAFARTLAQLGDLYVNDDFSTSHRSHASTALVPTLLPAFAGLNLALELRMLDVLRTRPKHPFIAVIGGGKVYDKLGTVRRLLPLVDHVLVGGAAASTVLKARGFAVGTSLVDTELPRSELQMLARSKKLLLPSDVAVARSSQSARRIDVPVAAIPARLSAFDIGPATIRSYTAILRTARTVFWSGPVGYAENPLFSKGTRTLARALSRRKTFAVIGGGDSLRAIRSAKLARHFTFLSTGGSAMLEYLAGKDLPGLTALAP